MNAVAAYEGWSRTLAGFILLLIASSAPGQGPPQGEALRDLLQLTGLGVVGRELAGETGCEPNGLGDREVSLLDAANGQVTARLEWRVAAYSCGAFLVRDNVSVRLGRGWDSTEISYESIGLVYYASRNGFARVFERTVPPGLWVRIADMPGGSLRPWPQLLVESPRTYRGYDGHPLHERPSEDSSALITLRERNVHDARVHQLIPTGQLSGEWGEFDVIEFNTDFYVLAGTPQAEPSGNKWKGWLRLVNSAGSPKLWFFTRD